MAVAIFIIGLLLGGILVPLETRVEQRQIRDTQKTLDEILEALLGFALANSRLPCPDVTAGVGANDGVEDITAGRCNSNPGSVSTGNVPWVTLGVASNDVWGNRIRYFVNESFARSDTLFALNTGGTNVRICTTAACTTTLSTTAIAAVMSHGRNSYGAINSSGTMNSTTGASADEIENTDGDRDVVSRITTGIGAAAGEFDDIVTWLSRNTLMNRMVAAGKLP